MTLIFSFYTATVTAQPKEITVLYNNKKVVFDQPPVAESGRTLVPFRAVFEAMGADVDWIGESRTAVGVRGNTIIALQLGNNIANVNNKKITLDVPANAINGRTLVPLRFVAESLGALVDWDGNTRTVTIDELTEEGYEALGIFDIALAKDNPKRIITNYTDENIIAYGIEEVMMVIPENTLKQQSTISIRPIKITNIDEDELYPVVAYDVTIDEQRKFDRDLEIVFSFNPGFLTPGVHTDDQIIMAYYDDALRAWIPIDYELFTEEAAVVFKIDHLTPLAMFSTRKQALSNNYKQQPISEGSGRYEEMKEKLAAATDSAKAAYNYTSSKIGDAVAYIKGKGKAVGEAISEGVVKAGDSFGKTMEDVGKAAGKAIYEGAEYLTGKAKEFYDTIGKTYDTLAHEVKAAIAEIKVMVDDYKHKDYQFIYKTEHFNIIYNRNIELDLETKKFDYEPKFSIKDYPKVEYGKTYVEIYEGEQLSAEELALLYQQFPSIDDVIPIRIREIGMALEESYRNYSKKFTPIDTPYTVYVGRSGSAMNYKFSKAIYVPSDFIGNYETALKTVGHELFHSVQKKYINLFDMSTNVWLVEATAEYASHKLAPNSPIAFDNFRANTFEKFFTRSLGTVEPLLWSRDEHEYRSAKFIDYLVRKHGLDLPGLMANYSTHAIVDDFAFLQKYMKTKSSNFVLGKAYLDHASFMLLDADGDEKKDISTIAHWKDTYKGGNLKKDINVRYDYIPKIGAIKVDIPDKVKKLLEVELKCDSFTPDISINVYVLKGNNKVKGTVPEIQMFNEKGKKGDITVEKGDVIYYIVGNSQESMMEAHHYDTAGSITIKEKNATLKQVSETKSAYEATVKYAVEGIEYSNDYEYDWYISTTGFSHDPSLIVKDKNTMTTTLVHLNPKLDNTPIELNPRAGDESPFGVSVIAYDLGTDYEITVTITDKKTKSVIGTLSTEYNVGFRGPQTSY